MAGQWNEQLSNQLKQLNTVRNPTPQQKAKIAQLQGIKQSSGGSVSKPANQQILKNNPKDTKSAVQGQYQANEAFGKQQEQFNRFDQTGPTGSQTWQTNPDGSRTLSTQLSGNQQGILEGQEALSQWGNTAAMQGVQGAGLDKAFDPRNAQYQEQQQHFTDAAFKELTRGWDKEKARDKGDLEQSLANKGIPTIPGASEAYDTANEQFATHWGDKEAQAKNQAVSKGLEMWGDVANTAAGINNQTLGQAKNLSQLGSGVLTPNFAAPGQIGFTTPDVAGTAGTFGQLANQKAALKPSGGGGQQRPQGPAQPASPFNDSFMG